MNNITEIKQLNQEVKFHLSLYGNITSPQAKPIEMTWDKVCARFEKPIVSDTKDITLYGPYRLSSGATRSNNNVLEVSLLVFDIDDAQGRSAKDIINLVADYDAILHSTWSHTKENPRYRLIIHLLNPIPAKNFSAVRNGFLLCNAELASIIDKACSDPSRAYYLFSYPIGRSDLAEHLVNVGKPLDPAKYLIPSQSNAQPLAINISTPIGAIASGGLIEGGRNNSLTKFVGGLIGQGKSFDESLSLALAWNTTLLPPMDEAEVERTHQSIWKTHLRNHPETETLPITPVQTKSIIKQFTLVPASDLLATLPPPREWLLTEFLPKKIVASIIAAGGTGKSFLAMHIAVALAAGSSLFSKYIASTPNKVIFISGEDDKTELQRRLHSVTQGMPPNLIKSISSNIQFIDLADSFELFTYKPPSGEVNMTTVPVDLVNAIKQKLGDEVGLVIVDPVSRFRGGEENSAGDTTRFVQALQYIRDQLSATVLTLHHVNKGAKTNGSTQNNARGSSAFIDGVRLVYELNAISEEEVKKHYDSSGIIPRLMTLNSVKSNYGKPIEPLTLSKKNDGSLELFTMHAGQHQKLAILQEIKVSQLSKTKFKETYGSATGKFGLSEKALVQKLDEYAKDGLINIPSRAAMQLTKSGESLLVA
jgi:RecA-family ATPase